MRDFTINAITLIAAALTLAFLVWIIAQPIFWGLPMAFNGTALRLVLFCAAAIAAVFALMEWLNQD